MSTLGRDLLNLTVTSVSPDGTVRVRLVKRGFTIELRQGAMRGHDEHSLADAIEAALNNALAGYGSKRQRITHRHLGFIPTVEKPDPVHDPIGYRIAELTGEVTAMAKSPRGLVKVQVTGQPPRFAVRLRPRSIGPLDVTAERLESEVNAAVNQAHREFSRLRRAIRDDVTHDRGVAHVS